MNKCVKNINPFIAIFLSGFLVIFCYSSSSYLRSNQCPFCTIQGDLTSNLYLYYTISIFLVKI